ncbi:beta-microseminoprotein-like isoform X2 [Scyliorhinus torazame]|uniref:beta-microseminoprotein-like isoform X2 n=1 Tax=Scyliorhinus torazame TaxID=75743 RepID=UPI003B5948A6
MPQKVFVCLILLLLTIDLCDSDCKFVMKTEAGKSDCMDGGMSYKVGAMWKSEDCYTCYCGKVTAICCTDYSQVPDVPSNCEAIFDKRLCKYKVYSKDNPDILCEV